MKYRRLQHIEYTSSSRPVFTSADKIKHFFIFSTLCAEGVKKPSIYAQHRVFRGSMCVCVRRYCLFFLYFMLFLFSRFFLLFLLFLSVKCSLTDTNCVRYQSRPSQLQNQCTSSKALQACPTRAAQLPARKLPGLGVDHLG